MTTRVLVTNDDGIDGEGLRVLTATLVANGYEPIVVAPDSDYSGAGTSIISRSSTSFTGTSREIAYERRTLAEAPDVEAYAVAAPPAMCTLLAMRGAFGEPADMVASGINWGLNTGGAVRHSGTVSAAVTAAAFGVPAVAVSAEHKFDDHDAPLRFDTAALVAVQVMKLLPATGHGVLNINVPRLELSELAGVAAASVSQISRYRSYVETKTDSTLTMGYMTTDDEVEPGSDTALVMAGYAAVSSLVGTNSIDCGDFIAQVIAQAA